VDEGALEVGPGGEVDEAPPALDGAFFELKDEPGEEDD
jgi:hypothetical protein